MPLMYFIDGPLAGRVIHHDYWPVHAIDPPPPKLTPSDSEKLALEPIPRVEYHPLRVGRYNSECYTVRGELMMTCLTPVFV